MIKILFVCYGNICRSPMAEFVMKKLASDAGISGLLEICSAGTSDEEHGADMYPPAKRKLAAEGIPYSPRSATLLRREFYGRYDYIIGMDAQNIRSMKRLFSGDPENKLSMMLDYTSRPGPVADPWFTGDFDEAYRDIFEGCTGLLRRVKAELKSGGYQR